MVGLRPGGFRGVVDVVDPGTTMPIFGPQRRRAKFAHSGTSLNTTCLPPLAPNKQDPSAGCLMGATIAQLVENSSYMWIPDSSVGGALVRYVKPRSSVDRAFSLQQKGCYRSNCT